MKGNTDWWMLKFSNGFGAHFLSLNAMVGRYDNNIIYLKEEGESSHVNKAYDKCVAREEKKIQNWRLLQCCYL